MQRTTKSRLEMANRGKRNMAFRFMTSILDIYSIVILKTRLYFMALFVLAGAIMYNFFWRGSVFILIPLVTVLILGLVNELPVYILSWRNATRFVFSFAVAKVFVIFAVFCGIYAAMMYSGGTSDQELFALFISVCLVASAIEAVLQISIVRRIGRIRDGIIFLVAFLCMSLNTGFIIVIANFVLANRHC